MKKKLIILLVILLIIFNSYFIYKNDIETNKYIIFDNNNLFYIKDGYLKKQNPNRIRLLNYSKSKLYSENKSYEEIYFDIKENINLYDTSKEKINFYDYYVLTNLDYTLNVKSINYLTEIVPSDQSQYLNILKTNGIYTDISNISVSKNTISLGNNNADIYTISSISNESLEETANFNLIYTIINGEVIVINKKITQADETYTEFSPIFYLSMDIDNDSEDEIVIQNSKYSSPNLNYYCVYKYDKSNNKFNLISDCKEE